MREATEAVQHAAMGQVLPPELYSSFLAISADAVIAVDEEQRIIFFNEGAERIFGWSASEVGGKYLAMLLPERYRSTHRGHVQGFGAAHGLARLMGERQEIVGLRKSGEEFPAEASIQRMEIGGKNIYAAVLRDVSARYRVEEALHQAIRARDDMMGIVSHDLRNPASAVKMLARSILAEAIERDDIPSDVAERVGDHAAGRGADRRADPGPARHDAARGGSPHRCCRATWTPYPWWRPRSTRCRLSPRAAGWSWTRRTRKRCRWCTPTPSASRSCSPTSSGTR